MQAAEDKLPPEDQVLDADGTPLLWKIPDDLSGMMSSSCEVKWTNEIVVGAAPVTPSPLSDLMAAATDRIGQVFDALQVLSFLPT